MSSKPDDVLSRVEHPERSPYGPDDEANLRTVLAGVATRGARRVEASRSRTRERVRRTRPTPEPFDDAFRDWTGFTATDAAYFLGIAPSTMRAIIERGEIPVHKTSAVYRIMRPALQALVRADPKRFPRRRFDPDEQG